ncbi:hypothetical protein [Actinoplanes sp. URMC 104]|uniref:phage terminase small subunit n=1 Tax=Actinoplanes sp. URMC 104 TaxID=3423409 RepID=UPI003F19EAA2
MPDKPFEDGPELPPLGRNKKWHPLVQRWWAIVKAMPHCVLWRDEDWQKALELAYDKDLYWKNGEDRTTSQATEIRRKEDQLGIGLEARTKLRIKYVVPPEVEEQQARDNAAQALAKQAAGGTGNVLSIADRRNAAKKPA